MGLSNYPPGVTGNEPEITGEWPCRDCGGLGYDEDEDGKHSCLWCRGTGIEPEEPPYCRNCGAPEEKVDYFLYNHTHDTWKCDNCEDEEDRINPRWEKW